MLAMHAVAKSATSDNKKTYAQAREEAEIKVTEQEADKAEKKNQNSKKYHYPYGAAFRVRPVLPEPGRRPGFRSGMGKRASGRKQMLSFRKVSCFPELKEGENPR